MHKKVILTGGPGTGKTTTLNLLKKTHLCLDEVSREVTLEAREKGIEQLFLSDPLLFSKILLKKRIEQYHHQPVPTFIDRGVHDVLAYMDFFNTPIPEDFIKTAEEYTYSFVFVFPPWKEIYTQDNERFETFEECQRIHKHIVKTYSSFGHDVIEVPTGTIDERAQFILNKLQLI